MAEVDEAQWIAWYQSLEKPLYNVVYRWLWDAAESQDVVQEAFLRCWRRRERIEGATFKALIFRTTIRLASNRVRRRRLWRFVPFAESGADVAAQGGDTLAAEELRKALAGIAVAQRQVLLLSELGGLSYKEIAEVMNIAEGTVASRRNRAIRELKRRLVARGVHWHED
jgi:RNA polymerase sigma-70 factor (ECF subfamily)